MPFLPLGSIQTGAGLTSGTSSGNIASQGEADFDTIASAATTDLATTTRLNVTVTGSVPITALGTLPAGTVRYLTFTGAPLVTYNAVSLILQGNASIQAAAGDQVRATSLGGGNWTLTAYSIEAAVPGSVAPGTVTAAMLSTALAQLEAQVTWGAPAGATAGQKNVPATVADAAGNTITDTKSFVRIVVTDSATSIEPSATATLGAADAPVGTIVSSATPSGTITMETSAGGLFSIKITGTSGATYFLVLETGMGSQRYVRANAVPLSVTLP